MLTSGYSLALGMSWVLTRPQILTLNSALNTSRKSKTSGQLVESEHIHSLIQDGDIKDRGGEEEKTETKSCEEWHLVYNIAPKSVINFYLSSDSSVY